MSTAMLRKLTELGAIGHVRWGTGQKRARVGYTDRQIEDFIASRTVPPSDSGLLPETTTRAAYGRPARPRRPASRRTDGPPADTAARLLKTALATGSVTEWKRP